VSATAETGPRVAIAVVRREDRFLIGRRPAGRPLAGLWEFPGGKVRAGEALPDAARRECLEETGLAIEVVGQYPPVVHPYPHGCVELFFFACRPAASAVDPKPPFRWVDARALCQYEFPAANRRLVEQLARWPPASTLAPNGSRPQGRFRRGSA